MGRPRDMLTHRPATSSLGAVRSHPSGAALKATSPEPTGSLQPPHCLDGQAYPTSAKMRNRTGTSLLSALRSLSIGPAAPQIRPCRSTQHTVRSLSQSVLSCSSPRKHLAWRDALKTPATVSSQLAVVGGVAALRAQQTRGMKVHSSIKKRCEHCKVRDCLLLT